MSKAETITIPTKDLSGSRLRCLMLTSPPEAHVAKVLSMLVPPLATVDEKKTLLDAWRFYERCGSQARVVQFFPYPGDPRRANLLVANKPLGR